MGRKIIMRDERQKFVRTGQNHDTIPPHPTKGHLARLGMGNMGVFGAKIGVSIPPFCKPCDKPTNGIGGIVIPHRISVIGAGYVGLVTAAGLASQGHIVVCIDTDDSKVRLINLGISPLQESGLGDMISQGIRSGNLKATLSYAEVPQTDLTLICVGTPSNSDGSINLNQIMDAAKGIGTALRSKKDYHVIAARSTIVPGTTKKVIVPLIESYSGRADFGIAYNPEFLQEGKAVEAFAHPDRIIIGETDKRAGDLLASVFVEAPIFRTDVTTAEMIKYASNAFLATKISFINEIANMCHEWGIDVYDVTKGLSFDYRIGDKFLSAGIGFGGSCLPKDLRALFFASGHRAILLRAVLQINESQSLKIVEIAERILGDLNNKRLGILGLSFKPNTDDVRESPAIKIINELLKRGAVVSAHDPMAIENAKKILPIAVKCKGTPREAIEGSDGVFILTEWDEYRDANLYKGKTVFDGRRALNPSKAKLVCNYYGVCW